MAEQTYLFIDGGHLRRYYTDFAKKWFNSQGDIDFLEIKTALNATKCFYYDCVDDIQGESEPEPDFKARVAAQEEFFERIQEVQGTHVRLGSMTGQRKNKRQKQVDILLAVDALNHAVRRNMSSVILITGDQDFKPVVQSLVDMGLFVTVAGDAKHTSKDLARAADHYRRLTLEEYHRWTTAPLKARHPLPGKFSKNAARIQGYDFRERGTFGGRSFELYAGTTGSGYLVVMPLEGNVLHLQLQDLQRLTVYCEMEFGKLVWEKDQPANS
jgi:uncharacterized LabA/DUF88 family protein